MTSETSRLPTGTVTFLITDIEGSTSLVIRLGEAYARVLDRHNALLREAIVTHGGTAVSTSGDSVFAVFSTATNAVAAAVAAQRALAAEAWPEGCDVRARMGIHTGQATIGGDDYVGLDVHRAARISAAAHGGQILLSAATRALVSTTTATTDLGEHRLKDLVHPERLFQVAAPDLASDFPPVRSLGGILTILPTPRTSFVARPEVAAVVAAVRAERLVTLTGPGGTGKTRLSAEAARLVKQDFPDGVALVDLSSVVRPDLVATTVVDTLGLDVGAAPPEQRVLRFLAERRMLLILDNFEQVIEAAILVAEILSACPGVHLLVTSRSPLRLGAEHEFPVPPLQLPGPTADTSAVAASPAVVLFADRARRVRPWFTVTADNAAAIATIARRLDGLPLALELAAARTKLLPPAAIASRLASTGSAELMARDRDVPERQRTMESVIAWSYELLSPQARVAMCRMAVFSGGAGLDELQAVLCDGPESDLLGLLDELTDQSLVRRYDVDSSDEPRFGMLMTISEFANARLSASRERAAIEARHAEAYLAFAEQATPFLTGWEQRQWLDRLEREHDNLRAALGRSIRAREAARSHRLVAALWRFWQIQGHLDEASRLAAEVLAVPGAEPGLRARALEAAGGIAWWRGEIERSQALYKESLDLLAPTADLAAVANARYNYGLSMGFGDTVDTAHADLARSELARARSEAVEAGDRRIEAWAIWGLSDVGMAIGEWDLTGSQAEQALVIFRELDDPFGVGWSLFMAANSYAQIEVPDLPLAMARLRESVRLFAGFRDVAAITLLCSAMAVIESRSGRLERALRLIGASMALRERTGARLVDVSQEMMKILDISEADSLERGGLTRDEARRVISEGERLSTDEVVAYLLEDLPEPDVPLAD